VFFFEQGAGKMDLIVNGIAHRHGGDGTPAALLAECGAQPGRTALLVNGTVIPAARHNEPLLKTRDTVEILTFAGGG